MERGNTATFTIDGRNLSGARAVIFDAPGITAKFSQITDLPEEAAGQMFSTSAAVPLAKKQSAVVEITVAKDVSPDVYHFRVQTPLGTTNMVPLAIGSLPEVKKLDKSTTAASSQPAVLPATLVGTIAAPGNSDRYDLTVKLTRTWFSRSSPRRSGPSLESLLALSDSVGPTSGRSRKT